MKADRPRPRGRAATATAIALTAVLAIAACGGGGSPKTTAGTTTPATTTPAGVGATGPFAARSSALLSCLRSHGVTLPAAFGAPGHGFGASGRFGPTAGLGASGRFGPTAGFGASGRFGPTAGFGASGRFGPTAGFGASGRFGVSGRFGARGFFGRFGASGRTGARGFLGANPKYAAAFRACAADFGGVRQPGAGAGFSVKSAADRAEVTKFVACVRAHGFDLPKPNFSGTGGVFSNSQVDRSSPAFKKASAACQSLLTFG
jgi:hypothetical protein